MNITELIVELLQQGQKVEVPGIGTFDSVVKNPHHDPVSHIYYPATRSIVYSETTTGDNSIVKEIARRDCVNEEVAQQMWRNYVDALSDKIKRTGEHRLGELGTITKIGDGYGFDMAEGVVIEAGNSNETPLEQVRTYEHNDNDDPFAQFEEEPVVTVMKKPEPAPAPAPEPGPEPEPAPAPEPEPEPEPEPAQKESAPEVADALAEGGSATVAEEWKESLKKLEELPKTKAQLKAEAKAEKERLKAEAKAEKESARLRKRAEKDAELEERMAAHKRESEERREAEERRRAEEEMRKAEERAEQNRLKAEKQAQASMKRAEEKADEERRKAEKKAAVLAAVAASQAAKGETVAVESVATLAQEVAKTEKETVTVNKENERLLRDADKAAAKEAKRKRKEEKALEKAAAKLAKEEKKEERKKGGSKWLLWVLLILLLLAFAAAVYYLFFRGHRRSAPAENTPAAVVKDKHLNVPVVNALTFNPDMIPYTDREIGRSRDIVCLNMVDYINNFLAERDYRNARVPMMDRVRQYADERMQQLLGPRFAVQRFIPYEDYVYEHAEPWLKQTYADVARHMVQGELMSATALEDILNGLVEELGLQPGEQQRTQAEVQQVKATEQAAVARKPKVQLDKDAPVYVYVEKNSKQGFDIIAGFYLNKNTAAKMTARLHELGCDAYIIEKNDMFYVSMGSAPTRTKAEALYNHIKSWYDGDIVIKEL